MSPSPAAATLEHVQGLQQRIRQMQATRIETPTLHTHPALAELLPGGALRAGSAYSVAGSTTLVMALLAGPSSAGAWCGVIGMPDFGAEAAGRLGVELERLVLIPHPGDQWLTITAALVDVLTVVVTRPLAKASEVNIARLSARLRQRGGVLIVLGDWSQAEAQLSVSDSGWEGLGEGNGYLTGRRATVTVRTRGGMGYPRSARLWFPDCQEEFRPAEPERLPQPAEELMPLRLFGQEAAG